MRHAWYVYWPSKSRHRILVAVSWTLQPMWAKYIKIPRSFKSLSRSIDGTVCDLELQKLTSCARNPLIHTVFWRTYESSRKRNILNFTDHFMELVASKIQTSGPRSWVTFREVKSRLMCSMNKIWIVRHCVKERTKLICTYWYFKVFSQSKTNQA